jgi:SAM-dependent methyltransferase
MGEYGKRFFDICADCGVEVATFVDNYCEGEYKGVKAVKIHELSTEYIYIYIICNRLHFQEICGELLEKGVLEENIFVFMPPIEHDKYYFRVADEHDRLPIPPADIKEYETSDVEHLETGKSDCRAIVNALERHNVEIGELGRIFEFGCADCRILRHFLDYPALSLFGADIQYEKINWCIANLPGINLIVNNAAPPLPFADGFFGLVYAGSVFTHLTIYHTAWMAELARVTKHGGYAYITFHDEDFAKKLAAEAKTGELLRTRPYWSYRLQDRNLVDILSKCDFDYLSTCYYHDNQAQVFMSKRYIGRFTSPYFELVDLFPDAYYSGGTNSQPGYLFKRV